jgi:hypothetical protein
MTEEEQQKIEEMFGKPLEELSDEEHEALGAMLSMGLREAENGKKSPKTKN